MKTIIAPVDFSDASANALSFAAELSKRSSARLMIVHIIRKGDEEEACRLRHSPQGCPRLAGHRSSIVRHRMGILAWVSSSSGPDHSGSRLVS